MCIYRWVDTGSTCVTVGQKRDFIICNRLDARNLLTVIDLNTETCFGLHRDGMLIRPHPVFWRLVNGGAILYLMALIFISMLDVGYVRTQFLPFVFDDKLGVRERTCKIRPPNGLVYLCKLFLLKAFA
jgi:hypothetical protein